jgi:type VI secretion system protein ImpF
LAKGLEKMAEVNSKTRLSPPLMHVFRAAHQAKDAKKTLDIRNEAGERVIASRRLRARHVITETVLRAEVSRDLEALLNTVALESTIDMTDMPNARRSIINFGIPDIADRTIDEAKVDNIPEEIKTAIMQYEPRLAASSLHVERDTSIDPAELKVRFLVRADLTCDPVHVPVEFVADVIDTGKILVNRL